MEEIKKAKLKALTYLLKMIDQKWDDFIKKSENLSFCEWEAIDWTLRFEAYSYIAQKDENKKIIYAEELRDLWNQWKELSIKGHIGSEEIFWTSVYEVEFDGKLVPCNEIESHISMFRVKEILGIGGFEAYFNAAKERLKNMLLEKYPHSWYDDFRITWQISRSPTLRLQLSDYLNVVYLRLKEEKEFNQLLCFNSKDDFGLSLYQAMCIFFLCFSELEGISDKFAKVVTSNLIDKQEKDGSFGCDVLSTCLCVSSIYFTKADPSNSVCSKAIKYILRKQNKEGYWHFLFGESNTWDILSTVVALETLDLITDDKPLPIWAEKRKLEDISNFQIHPRIQVNKPFPVLEEIKWEDVSICFISPDEVEVRAGETPLGVKSYMDMGFKDRRTADKPDGLWLTLKLFAENNGEISWKDKAANPRIRSYMKDIRKRLKFLFNITDDPLKPYRKVKAYKLKFKIWVREGVFDK